MQSQAKSILCKVNYIINLQIKIMNLNVRNVYLFWY